MPPKLEPMNKRTGFELDNGTYGVSASSTLPQSDKETESWKELATFGKPIPLSNKCPKHSSGTWSVGYCEDCDKLNPASQSDKDWDLELDKISFNEKKRIEKAVQQAREEESKKDLRFHDLWRAALVSKIEGMNFKDDNVFADEAKDASFVKESGYNQALTEVSELIRKQ